jgi:hypothetical protein
MAGTGLLELREIWVYLTGSPLLSLILTLVAYQLGLMIYERFDKNPLANPVAIAMAGASLIYLFFAQSSPPFVVIHRMVSGIDSFPFKRRPFPNHSSLFQGHYRILDLLVDCVMHFDRPGKPIVKPWWIRCDNQVEVSVTSATVGRDSRNPIG